MKTKLRTKLVGGNSRDESGNKTELILKDNREDS